MPFHTSCTIFTKRISSFHFFKTDYYFVSENKNFSRYLYLYIVVVVVVVRRYLFYFSFFLRPSFSPFDKEYFIQTTCVMNTNLDARYSARHEFKLWYGTVFNRVYIYPISYRVCAFYIDSRLLRLQSPSW